MKPYVGAIVQFKHNNRDPEPQPGMVVSINGDKVDINVFCLGTMTYVRNVSLVENAEAAEMGQCWLVKQS